MKQNLNPLDSSYSRKIIKKRGREIRTRSIKVTRGTAAIDNSELSHIANANIAEPIRRSIISTTIDIYYLDRECVCDARSIYESNSLFGLRCLWIVFCQGIWCFRRM